jgi:drug/metabolite transporter (DMT)-like permease
VNRPGAGLARRAEAALVLNTLIWGATFVVVKQALRDVSPILFLALRFSLASVALLILFRGSLRHTRNAARSLRGGMLAGVFLFAGYSFQTVGLQFTTAPKSAFLTGLTTVMVPVLAAIVYRTRPHPREMAGVFVATAGMALMTLPSGLDAVNRGDLLTIGCAVCYGAHILTLARFSTDASFEIVAVTQIVVSALLGWSLYRWLETPHIHWSPPVWVAIVVTGLFATALAFALQTWAQRYTTPTRTGLIFMLEPLFAWITSYLLTGETLTRRGAAGAGLILAGILVVEIKAEAKPAS